MIPKYVEKLLKRRERLANKLISACCDVDEYCEKIRITDMDEAVLGTHIMIYCEPYSAYRITKQAIEKKLAEKKRKDETNETDLCTER